MTKTLLPYLLACISVILSTQSTASDVAGTIKCTIIADAITGSTLYERGECSMRASPCSSFKFPLAIMGFDSGILQSPNLPQWELKQEYNPSQRDQTYKQVYPALWQSDSVVWFSQQLTRRLGNKRFEKYVRAFEYGNQDVSGDPGKHDGLTQSWLMSSLTISPKEKIQFLLRFATHKLPVSEAAYDMVRVTIPQYRAAEGWVVHGKSGSGWLRNRNGAIDEARPQGWFVGWAKKDGQHVVFARLEIRDAASEVPGGTKAREDILAELPMLLRKK